MPPQGQAFVKQLLKERRGCSVEMCFEPSAIGKNKQQQQKKQGLQKSCIDARQIFAHPRNGILPAACSSPTILVCSLYNVVLLQS